MDEHNQPRHSQNDDRDTSARLGNTSPGTPSGGASTHLSGREEVDAQETRRFTVELRAPDGQAVSRTAGNDAWRALQEFAGLASQDLGRRLGAGAVAQLSDRDGVYGVQLEVDSTGANQLKFDTDEGRALYKQVYRERQLAVSQAPMSNRIEAVAPELDQTTARASSRAAEYGGAIGQLRGAVLEQLQQRPLPETTDEQQRLERDRQVVARASFGQLGLIAIELAKDEPNQLRKVLDQVQQKVETSVGQNNSERASASSTPHGRDADQVEGEPSRTGRPLPGDPPIRERFTAIEHTWRTDYWQRDRPDRLGFSESWLTLKTAEHSAAVIMGMVDRARERGWAKLHLDGSPEFKREAWILATARGLQTSGYTATLGDREAVKSEQQRLSQVLRDRSSGPRAKEQTVRVEELDGRSTPTPSERDLGKARDTSLDAAITKAMREAQVPPALQARLRQMITTEAQRRQTTTPQWRAQVYDPAAPRGRSSPDLSPPTVKQDRQHER